MNLTFPEYRKLVVRALSKIPYVIDPEKAATNQRQIIHDAVAFDVEPWVCAEEIAKRE